MRFKRQFFGFLLLAISAAQISCGSGEAELKRARSLWSESGIVNYRMSVDLQKTGHAMPMGKFVIVVRDGKAESIQRLDKPDLPVMPFSRYDTIDDIFNYIEGSIKKEDWDWHKKEIEYDPKFGYPTKVNLDAAGVSDDELFFQVLQFEILQ